MADLMQGGLKVHAAVYTLGRYDAIFVVETTDPKMDEKYLVETLLQIPDPVQTEIMLAVPTRTCSRSPISHRGSESVVGVGKTGSAQKVQAFPGSRDP
jgi:hypothetical protein